MNNNEISNNLIESQNDSDMETERIITPSVIGRNNDDIILPDSTDLDWAQILYAVNYKRLLFINDYRTWLNFHTELPENYLKYNDYSAEDLCDRFLQRVLPNIYEYELTEQELHLISLLKLHPDFRATETGFHTVTPDEDLSFPPNKTVTKILMDHSDSMTEEHFVAENVSENNQILITSFREEPSLHNQFSFSEENAALLSVVLSSDDELPNCELLSTDEIYKRLKAAKKQFERNGHQLENIKISVEDLLKKLKTLKELKEAVTELVNKSFCK